MHGGLSPELKDIQQISNIPSPIEIPDEGLLCDLLWSDPQKTAVGWSPNVQRGISKVFGNDII